MFGLLNKLYSPQSFKEGIPAICNANLLASTNLPFLSQKRIPIGELLNSSLKFLFFTLIPP
jgi:hypothetical protein